mmetsp:Transcript_11926/g.9942  ORF Transcript_11926/g.9942 Transcript_11926/m.9942 type:complete len:109 (-) Transcript_11926:135-461(-)
MRLAQLRGDPKIADRIYANAMLNLSSKHRALWREADKMLNEANNTQKNINPNRRFSVPATISPPREPDKDVPIIPSGVVSSLGLDDSDIKISRSSTLSTEVTIIDYQH